MKRFLIYLRGYIEEPSQLFAVLLLLVFLVIAVWLPIRAKLPSSLLVKIVDMVTVIGLFSLGGIMGIVWIIRKEANIFIVPIKGIFAVVLGLFMVVSGFGGVIRYLILNIPRLFAR